MSAESFKECPRSRVLLVLRETFSSQESFSRDALEVGFYYFQVVFCSLEEGTYWFYEEVCQLSRVFRGIFSK